MKFVFIALILILISLDVVYSANNFDQYISRSNEESAICQQHQKELMTFLIPLAENHKKKKERDYDVPRDLKQVEKFLLAIDPLKLGIRENPMFGLEAILSLDDDSLKQLYEAHDCEVFDKLEIFKTLIAGNFEQSWPLRLESLLAKKILLMMQSQTVGIPPLLHVAINFAILKSANESGLYPTFTTDIQDLYKLGTEHLMERKRLFKDQRIEAWKYEFRSSLLLQTKLNILLQKIWIKELGL
jgi:hypothetical protein